MDYLILRHPLALMKFLRRLLFSGGVIGIGVSIPAASMLHTYIRPCFKRWFQSSLTPSACFNCCSNMQTFLIGYHLARLILTSLQLPLRIILLQRLHDAYYRFQLGGDQSALSDSLLRLSLSRVWITYQRVGYIQHVLLLAAAVLNGVILITGNVDVDSSLLTLLRAHAVLFVLQVAVSAGWLSSMLASGMQTFVIRRPTLGITTEQLKNSSKLLSTTETIELKSSDPCVICLEPIDEEKPVRLLATCGHIFHSTCISEWSCIKGTCPLCNRRIIRTD